MISKIYPYEIRNMIAAYLTQRTGQTVEVTDIDIKTHIENAKKKDVNVWVEWTNNLTFKDEPPETGR
jgi:hypothetical protein